MPELSTELIRAANDDIERYQYRVEQVIEETTEWIFEVGMDRVDSRQHVLIGTDWESFPEAEIHQEAETGVGRIVATDAWFPTEQQSIPDLLTRFVELLDEHEHSEVEENGDGWVVRYDLDSIPLPIRDRPHEFFREVFGAPGEMVDQEFLTTVAEITSTLTGSAEITIDRDSIIQEARVELDVDGKKTETRFGFESFGAQIPLSPQVELDPEAPSVTPGSLLFQFDSIGGWSEGKSHAPWAQRTLDALEAADIGDAYKDIYDDSWSIAPFTESDARPPSNQKPSRHVHHPIVLGSYYEDREGEFNPFYRDWFDNVPAFIQTPNFRPGDYKRSYHHYGGEATGLEYKFYFEAHGPPPRPKGDRFYSARDWGFGGNRIDESLNKLTFTGAIQQYNRYSKAGTRNALLMIGHLLHLLQYQEMPDHAQLVPHPASSKTEKEAYRLFEYCHFLATEAALAACAACWAACGLCMAGVFEATEVACWAGAEDDEVGYERLIGDVEVGSGADRHQVWSLDRVRNSINATRVRPEARDPQYTYDQFFKDLSDYAKARAEHYDLDSPLGLGWLKLIPPIPGCDPDIDTDDPGQYEPYLELTDDLVPRIVSYSAGFLQYCYEVVNHPRSLRTWRSRRESAAWSPRDSRSSLPLCKAGSVPRFLFGTQLPGFRLVTADGSRSIPMRCSVQIMKPISSSGLGPGLTVWGANPSPTTRLRSN
ncbi:hypothetical protein [Halobellus litoreus]|uniref:Uncharacterized protein n=1 Tax=Halobellus litoreus TaxID=755310 RepID=A0ABD6DYU2_9EURY|nr:hypothetical protein [Halobellus litoreus]